MQAITYEQYGLPEAVLQQQTVEKPTPKENEVLIKVYAVSLNAADWGLLTGDPFMIRLAFGLKKPKISILGADVAGKVEAVGANVRDLKPGDEVFGDLSGAGFGGLAEYVCAPADVLAHKPASLSFVEASAIPMASVTALQALRNHGNIEAGKKVLINGASGGVGTFAVQIAKSFGAEVTAVASSSKLDLLRTLGADHVIDYTRENFTTNGKQYDLIIAANGYHPILHYKRALSPNGVYVAVGGKFSQTLQAMILGSLVAIGGNKKLGGMLASPSKADLEYVVSLIEAGKVRPVIDSQYPLSQARQAFDLLGKKHAKGKIVITVAEDV